MFLGCHVNFGSKQLLGCAKQAHEYGANTFMFYTGAPQNTFRKPVDDHLTFEAKKYMEENHINFNKVICHAPYIINLANKKEIKKWEFSIQFLKQEISRCEEMGITKMVLHPGSAVGISHEEGIQNIIEALNEIIREDQTCKILLETMAGKGNECGGTLEELKEILNGVTRLDKIGICMDTCHLNDAGYSLHNFVSFLEDFDKVIGLNHLQCIHLNDSKNECGTHKDRHENIGFGTIGFETLLTILNHPKLKEVPFILETPYVGNSKEDKLRIYPPYRFEIMSLKNQKFNKNLYEDIVSFYKKD